MKGDFSQWYFDPNDNFNGVLHQQGKVLLDSDWNAQTRIQNDWQETAAQDIIGSGVAAVPADTPAALQVTQAKVTTINGNDRVELTLLPGRIWADGLLVHLPGKTPVSRIATYLQPPIQDPAASETTIGAGIRDAVILEVWQEAVSGFQIPSKLIEPALGGPDTTERMHTAFALRLFRLAEGETCDRIRDQLQDNFDNKGKLTASLQPPVVLQSDCPVVEGGGYTGFEHQLYRIEIAQVKDATTPMFKWSQFNGGLVGRGKFDAANHKVEITANLPAIESSRLNEFYLEAIEYDSALGYWNVTYGAKVTRNGSQLDLPTTAMFCEIPASNHSVFFRLWNDIRLISDFPISANPTALQDGIHLEFEAPGSGKYTPGDYWTFTVRAGEIGNQSPLIDAQPPEGIHYHRVPLAELNWNSEKNITFDHRQIEDCRTVFPPLTRQKSCCSFTVGDGQSSYGDFNDLEIAVQHLPASGGEICLLPGLHRANVLIEGKQNIKIKGCDKRTQVIPKISQPIFHIIDSQCITLEHMDLVTLEGTAILLEGRKLGSLKEITIDHNRILAYQEAIHVQQGLEIHIRYNKIRMLDKAGAGVAIYLAADNSCIERNDIGVIPAASIPPPDRPDGETPDPTDPCVNIDVIYRDRLFLLSYLQQIWTLSTLVIPTNPFNALGGIQIAGGSERVEILENQIHGGAGNGIALGTSIAAFLAQLDTGPQAEEQSIEHPGGTFSGLVRSNGTGVPNITVLFEQNNGSTLSAQTGAGGYFSTQNAAAGLYQVDIATPGYQIERITFQQDPLGEFNSYQIDIAPVDIDLSDLFAFLYDIQIDRNEISHMGLSGIGLPRVTLPDPLPKTAIARQLAVYVRLLEVLGNPVINLGIDDNHIFNCFQNPLDQALRAAVKIRGIGGISLGLCANLSIHRNRIEANGTSPLIPVCGIFVTYGELIEITHNWLAENGRLTAAGSDFIPGRQGGIVLGASSFPILNQLSAVLTAALSVVGATSTSARLLGQPAARVHDNIVNQPVGRALTLLAFGPVSVVNNHFNSEISGIEGLEQLVGAVFILNLGGLNRLGNPGIAGAIASTTTLTGTPSFTTVPSNFARNPSADLRLPDGNTLFNNNQTRLGFQNTSLISQLIFSTDDVGFDGNQSDELGGLRLTDRVVIAMNTVLWATTLRATDNRFKEIFDVEKQGSFRISLLTLSIVRNNTTNNQGDHCIFTFNADTNHPPIATGNQILDNTLCPRLFSQVEG